MTNASVEQAPGMVHAEDPHLSEDSANLKATFVASGLSHPGTHCAMDHISFGEAGLVKGETVDEVFGDSLTESSPSLKLFENRF